jgi:hypothetical protein
MRRDLHKAPCHGDETPWFDGHVKPVRVGLYQRKLSFVGREWVWSWWSGTHWGLFSLSPSVAVKAGKHRSGHQHLPWRGLCEKPTRATARINRP